jgi:integrase
MGRQRGCIYKSRNGERWLARWREFGKMQFRDLAPVNDSYRTKRDVQPLLDDILRPVNTGRLRPEASQTVAEYGENHWLVWVRENCKPSTIAGYERYWATYLEPRLQHVTLRDFRTVDAANILSDLHRSAGHGRTMLKHCKAILSGIFTLARNQGVLDVPNPVQGTMIPKKAAAPSETHAVSLEEVTAMLHAVDTAQVEGREIPVAQRRKTRAAIALQFFAGLRPGEARGVRWEDLDARRLTVRQSVWRTHVTPPKTEDSVKAVPLIEPLRGILAELREADGNPTKGPVLRGPSGKPLNLDNLSKRVLSPILKSAKMEWHGWYSLRRGVATTLASTSHDPLASKGLLRHSSLATTQKHYIKDVPENTLSAMNQLEQLFNDCSTTKQ